MGGLVGHGVDHRDEVSGREGGQGRQVSDAGKETEEEKETLDALGVALVEGR